MSPPDAGRETGSGTGPVRGLAHIAIAAHDAEPLAATLVHAFGGRRGEEELLDGGSLRVVFVHLGPVTVEILEPRSDDHTVAKFLESRGPGLHHVSLEMNDLDEALRRAKESGVRLIDESPRAGAHGSRVAFLHPKSLGGVLIELTQSRSEPS